MIKKLKKMIEAEVEVEIPNVFEYHKLDLEENEINQFLKQLHLEFNRLEYKLKCIKAMSKKQEWIDHQRELLNKFKNIYTVDYHNGKTINWKELEERLFKEDNIKENLVGRYGFSLNIDESMNRGYYGGCYGMGSTYKYFARDEDDVKIWRK